MSAVVIDFKTRAVIEPSVPVVEAPKPVEAKTTVEVGDFFYDSWGYDQTNVDFYKVVGLTPSGKSVRVQKWTKVGSEMSEFHDRVVPGDGPVMVQDYSAAPDGADFWDRQAAMVEVESEIMTKRVSYFNGRASFRASSFSNAYSWDGKPCYQTGPYGGH